MVSPVNYYRCEFCGHEFKDENTAVQCERWCRTLKRSGRNAISESGGAIHRLQEAVDVPKGKVLAWRVKSLCGKVMGTEFGFGGLLSRDHLTDDPVTCKTCLKMMRKQGEI